MIECTKLFSIGWRNTRLIYNGPSVGVYGGSLGYWRRFWKVEILHTGFGSFSPRLSILTVCLTTLQSKVELLAGQLDEGEGV